MLQMETSNRNSMEITSLKKNSTLSMTRMMKPIYSKWEDIPWMTMMKMNKSSLLILTKCKMITEKMKEKTTMTTEWMKSILINQMKKEDRNL